MFSNSQRQQSGEQQEVCDDGPVSLDLSDPFGDDDDGLFANIDIDECAPPPQKRAKQETDDVLITNGDDNANEQQQREQSNPTENGLVVATSDDPFENGDDDELFKIAEALEVSEELFGGDCSVEDEDDDGVPPENRFRTKIGRPHPMLIPQVYEKVISHLNDASSLLAVRSVCTLWKDAVQDKAFKHATLRNARHIIESYPYGLAFGENNSRFKPPYITPELTRIHIADPCILFTSNSVDNYFYRHGKKLKYLAFDANLYCPQQWAFIRSVLTSWCPNLVELELIGVSCLESLITYSEVYGGKPFKLTKLVVRCSADGERDHHHTSTVTRASFDQYDYTVHRLACRRDGGLLTKIFGMSPRLTSLTFHFNFTSAAGIFAHLRMSRVVFERITVLELISLSEEYINNRDLRMLRLCSFPLTTLKLGPLWAGEVTTVAFEHFLTSLAGTLVHLELIGAKQRCNYDRLGIIRFTFPEMPLLQTLRITDMSRMRIGNLNFLVTLPGLVTLNLGTEQVPRRFKTRVFRSLTALFNGQFQGPEHICLRNFALTGCYANVVNHSSVKQALLSICPKLNSLSVACKAANVSSVVESYRTLEKLKHLAVDVNVDVPLGFHPFTGIFDQGYESLRILSISVLGNVPLRLGQVLKFGKLYEISLCGIMLHDDESQEIAKALAERINYTNFRNCRIVKTTKSGQVAGMNYKTVHNVTLTLVNLHVLMLQHFHVT